MCVIEVYLPFERRFHGGREPMAVQQQDDEVGRLKRKVISSDMSHVH